MTGKQEGPYKGEETKAEEDKVWHYGNILNFKMTVKIMTSTTLQLKYTLSQNPKVL